MLKLPLPMANVIGKDLGAKQNVNDLKDKKIDGDKKGE